MTPPPVRRFLWAATAVLLIAALLRLLNLSGIPPGLAQDEVLDADIVRLIRAGGHALFFREGYGHEPLYHYWATPFQLLLGDHWLAMRLPSVVLGLLLVAATMRWARRDFGTAAALTAGGLLAVSWWVIIFSRIGIRPIMLPLFWVAALWFWRTRPLLAGLILGLSLYTYTSAQVVYALPILYGAGQLLFGANRTARQTAVRQSALILLITVLVGLPLYLTWRADPTLLQRVDQLSGPLDALRVGDVAPLAQAIWLTLGVFSFTGDPRWTYMLPNQPLLGWGTAVFLYMGLFLALWRLRQPRYTLLLALLFTGLLPSMLTPQTPSTIRMVGAIPAVFVLIGVAVTAVRDWLAGRWQGGRATAVTGALLLLIVGGTLLRTVQDGRAWVNAVETRVNHYQTFLWSAAHYLQQNPTGHIVIADAFFEPIDADSLHRTLGYDEQARWVQADALVIPAGTSNGRLFIPEFAPIHPDLLAAAGLSPTPLYQSDTIPAFTVYALPPVVDFPPLAEPVSFDGRIQLTGYQLTPPTGNEPLQLITFWRVQALLPWNLTAFVHLLDANGTVVAQHDGLNAAPATLQPGDLIVQRHTISVPADAAAPFSLLIGLYTPDNGRRLLTVGESADSYRLQSGLHFDGE
jgi:4-amino-4-deoxy-L-arabinose transferase-like glycosyltransferase